MRGCMMMIDVDGKTVVNEYREPLTLNDMKDGVKGYIEVVPYFDSVIRDGVRRSCVAFCNEHGKIKRLAPNPTAQAMWEEAFGGRVPDQLVGPVIIVFGDKPFMREL